MSTADSPRAAELGLGIRAHRLSSPAALLVAGAAVALTAAAFAVTPLRGGAQFMVLAGAGAAAAVTAATWALEGRRRAVDRLATVLVAGALLVALTPLGLVLFFVLKRGLERFDLYFLTHSMAGVGPLDATGGVYHAVLGTLEQVGIATAVSVPLGVLVAIYVTEYGVGTLAKAIRFFVDVMTGIPSIVAGLFIYAFWVLLLRQGYSGLAAALALSVLMLPIVIRSAEEMIRLVPDSLREASYALGVPKWRTIVSVVLPSALTGITTGVMLAVARVTGETAPLILTTFGNDYIRTNPFNGPQSALPLFVFQQAGSAFDVAIQRAWAGALTLVLIVAVLYFGARLLTWRNALTRR